MSKTIIPKTEEAFRVELASHAIDLLAYTPGPETSKARLKIRCLTCGEVEEGVLAGNIVRRREIWCKGCRGKFAYTTRSIKELIEKHGGTYLSGEVENRDSEIELLCSDCGERIIKRAQDIRRTPEGCHLCRVKRVRQSHQAALVEADHLSAAKELARSRGGQCLTENAVVRTNDKLTWQCSLGHTWVSQYSSVRNQGTWCPTCAGSIGENTVRALMEGAFKAPFARVRPEFLGGLELDGYNADLKVAIEVQGVQHFHQSPIFHRKSRDLHQQIERDLRKQSLCLRNHIKLVLVPYHIADKGLEALRPFLHQYLRDLDLRPAKDIREVTVDMRTIYDMTKEPRYQEFLDAVTEKGGRFSAADYQGTTRKLAVTCAAGHTWMAIPHLVISGTWCPECAGVLPKNNEKIKELLAEKGWSLREEITYRNAHQPLPLWCPNGHPVNRTWNAWQQKKLECKRCQREAEARQFMARMKKREIEIALDVSSYNNGFATAAGTCMSCGHKEDRTVASWKHIARCPGCQKPLAPYHRCLKKGKKKPDPAQTFFIF